MAQPHKFPASTAYDNQPDGWNDWNDWNDDNANAINRQTPIQQQQSHQYQPNIHPHPIQSSFQPKIGQQNVTASYGVQPAQRITNNFPQHNLPQFNYNLPPGMQQTIPNNQYHNSNLISDSFSNENSNWNWSMPSNDPQSTGAAVTFQQIGKEAAQKHSQNTAVPDESDKSAVIHPINTQNLSTSQPDDIKNTPLSNPLLSRVIRSEHQLTPQWSIESQMSHTSSDRSIESDLLDSRSTNTSDEHQRFPDGHNLQSIQDTTHYYTGSEQNRGIVPEKDGLSNALAQMSVDKTDIRNINYYQTANNIPMMGINSGSTDEVVNENPGNLMNPQITQPRRDFIGLQNLNSTIQPPLAFATPAVNPSIPSSTQFQQTYMHQMTTNTSNMSNPLIQPPPGISQHPLPPPTHQQQTIAPPPPPLTGSGGANPFKRNAPMSHKNLFIQPSAQAAPNVYQPLVIKTEPQDPPDNSEILETTSSYPIEVENHEIAPHNDRNQYLQTGHLSEDTIQISHHQISQNLDLSDPSDNLPPPGLSRYVLGQPERSETRSNHQFEPPPGFDRMVPGTEIPNCSNMERQADGEDTVVTTAPIRNLPNFMSPQQQQLQHHQHDESLDITDRNLYLVAGESEHNQPIVQQTIVPQQPQPQRVVTGLENVEPNTQQRELLVDGENLEDQQRNLRIEPIEGANTLDELSIPASSPNPMDNESMNVDVSRKYTSNPSTGNEDSDRDRQSYYRSSTRRNDDGKSSKRRDKDRRYDTEDTDYYSDRDRNRRWVNREGREGSVRGDRYDRSSRERYDRSSRDRDSREREWNRGEKRDRRDKGTDKVNGGNRDAERDYERKRGDRNDRYKDKYDRRDRYGRYETDGSRYETEDSRYERSGKRRPDYDDKRADKDKNYRDSDRQRERPDDDRRRGDRYRDERDADERRNKNKHRGNERNYENYEERRTGSRNASDRERDRDKRYPANYYTQTYGYEYDQYTYYQQQQYYDQLRRTNPKAYAEWYKRYYSQAMQSTDMLTSLTGTITTDGRESVHSGRSSNNDKERYTARQQFYDPTAYHRQFNQQHNSTMLDSSNYLTEQQLKNYALSNRSNYAQSEMSESRIGNLSGINHAQNTELLEAQRSTPRKFTEEHCIASLANGLLVCVKPRYSQNEITNVVKVINFAVNDSTKRLFQCYPGPLNRYVTHKKSVIEFCEDQIRLGPVNIGNKSRGNSISSINSIGQLHKPSYTLMWKLLILLLRQNGIVVGTDIAELLMKNRNEYPYECATSSKSTDVNSHKNSRSGSEGDAENNGSDDQNEIQSDNTDSRQTSLSEEEITDKFRNFLIYGSINEALEFATDNNLWGHALFLASKVDRRSHGNVLMKFANKLNLNDPLQTLYQLMSGRTPSSVTSVQDEKWGDWRPHLAMILSNTSPRPELDRRAITTLGDSLYNRGDLFAAQFCYLMAEVSFGKYSNVNQDSILISNSINAIRIILLGSSQHKTFREFATNEAIMMTEIYEYARSLNDDKYSIVEFQPYKFLLATRMLDYGMHLKTLTYMEQIASHIQRDPSKYENGFISRVYQMADQLKHFDPASEKVFDDSVEGPVPSDTLQSFEDQPWLQELLNTLQICSGNNIQNYGYNGGQQLTAGTGQSVYGQNDDMKQQIDQQFVQINQQFSELNLQYNQSGSVNVDPSQSQYQNQTTDRQFDSYNPQMISYDINQQQPQSYDSQITSVDNRQESYGNFYGNVPQEHPTRIIDAQQVNYDYQQAQIPTGEQPTNYDYWKQQSSVDEVPKPSISMPNSTSKNSAYYEEPSDEKQVKGALKNPSKPVLKESTKQNIAQSSSSGNSGWFGGIWNKLSLKPKNQMILPDDKNPSIVWDADKKRWVNVDGDSVEEENFKPPPKMGDLQPTLNTAPPINLQLTSIQQHDLEPIQHVHEQLNPQSQQLNLPLQQLPNLTQVGMSNTSEPIKRPGLQSNMFKMQRNRTLKNSYVDVFNPSGAPIKPIEPILAPTAPVSNMPQSGFLIPENIPTSEQSQEGDVPQFYNPNLYGGYQQ